MHEIRTIFRVILEAVNQGRPIYFLVIVGLTALTEVGIPTLGLIDAVLLYVGYQFGLLSVRAVIVVALLTLGRMAGSSAIYWPSRVIGKAFIDWFERRFPSVSAKINQVVGRLTRRQTLGVVIVRFTPGFLTTGTVAAGMLKIKYKNFMVGVIIHSVIADVALILIGFLGKYGVTLAGIHLRRWQVITAAILLVVGVSVGLFFYQRLRNKRKRDNINKLSESDQSGG